MSQKQSKNLGLIIAVIIVIVIPAGYALVSRIMIPDVAEVKAKMENALLEKYGEQFVVEQIGTRSAHDGEFFQARIYPESIEGTSKEYDSYYYASASIDKLSFGRLGEVGDSYPLVKLKLDIEKHLTPKIEEIFGKRIQMKIEAHYKRREPGNETFWGYKVNGFEEAKTEIAKDPDNRMIELEIYIYIFDRIDNTQEKEERRKQIFEFVQHLKDEGLFRYLEMGVIFIDERVLAPSYGEYRREIVISGRVEEVVEGEKVSLPPMELREEMSEVLQDEIDDIDSKELINKIKNISKSKLSYKGINKNNAQASCYIYSPKLIKLKYPTALKKGMLTLKNYDNVNNIIIEYELEYVYLYN